MLNPFTQLLIVQTDGSSFEIGLVQGMEEEQRPITTIYCKLCLRETSELFDLNDVGGRHLNIIY